MQEASQELHVSNGFELFPFLDRPSVRGQVSAAPCTSLV